MLDFNLVFKLYSFNSFLLFVVSRPEPGLGWGGWGINKIYYYYYYLEHSLPKPSISLSHDEEVTLGSNVTIDCRSNGTAVRFYFQKYGVAKPVQLIQKNGTVAKFSISNASWEHSGYYSCTYSALPDCFAISEPSDEVELQLTDPDLARPTISLSPRGPLPLGGNVTLNCQGQGVRFKFYRHRENFVPPLLKNNLDGAHLIISNLSRDDAVGYSCKCSSISEVFSVSSEIVKLLILDSPLFAPVISIQHEGCVALGGQVEIKCESDSEDVNFSLHKTGDTNPMLMNGHFYVGEFTISSLHGSMKATIAASMKAQKSLL
uniref:T-cell-interacting, activating receptor on myeloid cells protein 1-like n=1 Tax=Podarcis muralis TaxID=64176 RepID=UPI0010A0478D|nr:T-cell-interacting, activating receptor on myeloid cells protein 1-like [Podarcis muralis]